MFNLPMKKSFSRIDNAVEWDEVETIAKELFELVKSQQSQTDVSQSAPTVSDQEGDTEQSASGDSDEEGMNSPMISPMISPMVSQNLVSLVSLVSLMKVKRLKMKSTSSESTTEDGETEESDDVGSESDYSSDDSAIQLKKRVTPRKCFFFDGSSVQRQ